MEGKEKTDKPQDEQKTPLKTGNITEGDKLKKNTGEANTTQQNNSNEIRAEIKQLIVEAFEEEKFNVDKVIANWTRVMGITAIVLAACAIVGSIFTTCQIKSSEKTIDSTFKRMDNAINAFKTMAKADSVLAANANESFVATQKNAQTTFNKMDSATYIENRAFILISNEGVTPFIDYIDGSIVSFQIYFKNTGKTPAYNIRITGKEWWGSFDTSSLKKNWIYMGYAAANQYIPIRANVKGIFIKDILTNKNTVVYDYGEIRYDDFFGKHHITTYFLKIAANNIQYDRDVDSMIKVHDVPDDCFGFKLMPTHNNAN